MNYNYTACCWFPSSSNIIILPSQFWQIRFESYWLHCSKCRILVPLRYSLLRHHTRHRAVFLSPQIEQGWRIRLSLRLQRALCASKHYFHRRNHTGYKAVFLSLRNRVVNLISLRWSWAICVSEATSDNSLDVIENRKHDAGAIPQCRYYPTIPQCFLIPSVQRSTLQVPVIVAPLPNTAHFQGAQLFSLPLYLF